ncbi:hypothetical protein [Streptomyces sp. NPDC055607]
MRKRTRIRIARIAAGAVMAAGVSLTAAGAAQAAGVSIGFGAEVGDDDPPGGCEVEPLGCNPEEPKPEEPKPEEPKPEEPKPEEPKPEEPKPEEPKPEEPKPEEPKPEEPKPEEPKPEEPKPEEPKPEEPKPEEPKPEEPKPEEPKPEQPAPGDPDPSDQNPEVPGTDGSGPAESSTSGGGDGAVVDNTDTNNAGSQPVQQGEAKEELAETGATETSFLVIGAATMIAGGIGFRMLPRLVAGGRTAA